MRSRPGHPLLDGPPLIRGVLAGILVGVLAGVVPGCGGASDAPDLDGDGIADLDDECQASEADGRGDLDGDALPNATDPCPFDAAPHLGDADGDGVPESCDPFPATTGADAQRCVTAFVDPVISEGYLAPRDGEAGWMLGPPLSTGASGATGAGAVSMVSIFPATDHRSTTYELIGMASFATANASSYVKLWLRAGATPSDDDVACGIDGTGNLVVSRGPERTG
nr:thrombospondin type 3 repeat-containing protein [Deltaproteobacteria bacterium]